MYRYTCHDPVIGGSSLPYTLSSKSRYIVSTSRRKLIPFTLKKKNNDDLFFSGDGFEHILIMPALDFCFLECLISNQLYKTYGLDFYYN